jgi:hypothetical protein
MYYSYIEIEYVATSFSPARTDLALKLLMTNQIIKINEEGGFWTEVMGDGTAHVCEAMDTLHCW